ncbi:MAG: LamG-like jellyroll fold domain-containing protein [Planctomycetota bacterium]|nr:LamG-like jellyroll fold domain-containing protein [Planctomycetota bacterium]
MIMNLASLGRRVSFALAAVTCLGTPVASAQITIPIVPIGNPGNAPDPTTGYGSVAYTYNIGTTEVTNAQYAAFLNAKAASDPFNLYNTNMAGSFGGITRSGSPGSYTYSTVSGRENNPVNFVSFWDATRFANWLHNGQGSGDTETGAYTLTPDGINNNTVMRNAGWRWAVTSEDEWYKAAYHQPASAGGNADNYWLYPTSSNTAPIAGLPPAGQANYNNVIGNYTPVGSYAANYYGTFDMGGNVWEWNEAIIFGSNRSLRGGSFLSNGSGLRADVRIADSPANDDDVTGFRVSRVVSPSDGCAEAPIFSTYGTFSFDNRLADTGPVPTGCALSVQDVFVRWIAPATGRVRFSTCGLTGVDTDLSVHTSCIDPPLECNDQFCGDQSELVFDAVAGVQYYLRIATYPGTPTGEGQFSLTPVTVGGSASLVDSTYLTTANSGGINPQQFTLEARIQPTGPGYGGTNSGPGAAIIEKPRQGATGLWLGSMALYWSPVSQRVTFVVTHVFGSSGTSVASNAIVGVGQSAHVAGTFDGTTLRLYINGVLDASATAVSSVVYYGANEPVLIGAGNFAFGFTRRFQGRIDDVRIWSAARSASDIAANAVCQLPTGPQPNLLAHWVFDNSSTVDQSGNNRNASFVAGPPAFGPDLATPVGWTQLPVSGPASRATPAMVYDTIRDRAVMYSGSFGSQRRNDTWEWNGAAWLLVSANAPQVGRSASGAAFDVSRGRFVLFGGALAGDILSIGDTNEWDGSSWFQRLPSPSGPGLRCCLGMTYDAARGHTLLFGGINGTTVFRDTWRWDGSTWLQLSNTGPSVRYAPALADDPVRQRVVFFGGTTSFGASTFFNDTWEWDGSTWTQKFPAVSPPARRFHTMAFDPVRNAVILFGGEGPTNGAILGDTWAWDGTNWTLLAVGGPSPRAGPGMVYDEVRRGMLLFGGATSATVQVAETWFLPSVSPFAITRQPVSTSVCAGTDLTLDILAIGDGPFTYQWLRNGVALANGGRISGATSPVLTVSATVPADSGVYACVVSQACSQSLTSGAATVTLRSPSDPACIPPCDPDFNADGNVDQDDIECLAQVVAGDPSCSATDPDFNRDGNVDQDDIDVLAQVVAGSPCP